MALRYPNRTGEVATFESGGIPFTGNALTGLRSFAAALTAGQISEGDYIGVFMQHQAHQDRWLVGIAEVHPTQLTLIETEDESATPIAHNDPVTVTAVLTDRMLASSNMTYEIAYQSGPDWWIIIDRWGELPVPAEWDAENGWYVLTEYQEDILLVPTDSGDNAGWGSSITPKRISAEVWVPSGKEDWEYDGLRLALNNEPTGLFGEVIFGNPLGLGKPTEEWLELEITEAQLSGVTEIKQLDLQVPTNFLKPRLRNIRIET